MKSPMNASSSETTRRVPVLRILGTLLSVGLLVYLLSQQGWGEIWKAVQGIPYWRLILAFALMIVSRFAVTGRWHTLLSSSGLEVRLGQTIRITFAGLFASNFLPTTIGGDVVRLAGVLQLRLDAAVCAASLIADRLVGMAGMAMALPFGLPFFLHSPAVHASFSLSTPRVAGGISLPFVGERGRALASKGLRLSRRLFESLSLWLHQPRALLAALVFTWIHMLCLFSILFLLFGGMGENIPLLLIGGLYSLVYFVTLLPISINGYGVQEISMTFIFSTVVGASLSSALSAALLFRTMMVLASLPGVFFVPEMLSRVRKAPQT